MIKHVYSCSRGAVKALADLSRRRAANAESFAYLLITCISKQCCPDYVLYFCSITWTMYYDYDIYIHLWHDDMKSWYVMVVLVLRPSLANWFWNQTLQLLMFPQAHTWVTPSCHELGFTALVPLLDCTADILAYSRSLQRIHIIHANQSPTNQWPLQVPKSEVPI